MINRIIFQLFGQTITNIITENICTFIKTNILKIPKQIRINKQRVFDDYSQIRYRHYQLCKSSSITRRKTSLEREVYKIPLEEKNLAIIRIAWIRRRRENKRPRERRKMKREKFQWERVELSKNMLTGN